MLITFGIRSTSPATPRDALRPSDRLFQDLVRRLASEQVTVRDANFRGEIGALDMHVRRILVLEEHQELEAASRD